MAVCRPPFKGHSLQCWSDDEVNFNIGSVKRFKCSCWSLFGRTFHCKTSCGTHNLTIPWELKKQLHLFKCQLKVAGAGRSGRKGMGLEGVGL